MSDSVLKKIYNYLKNNINETYFPGQHVGECFEPYVVIKMDGTASVSGISSERPIYTIMCYVPQGRFTDLYDMVLRVKDIMRGLYPMVMYAGNETPEYYDEQVNGNMISFQYYGIRKIRNYL